MNSQRLTCLIVILLCAIAAQAQSGRRQPKVTPAAPVPTPTPEPTPTPKTEDKKPHLEIFVAADRDHNYDAVPWRFYDAALRGCGDRLRESGASIDVSQNSVSRGDAVKKAKSGNSYVVLIILTFDAMARSYDDLQLHFTVFAPTTSKVVTTGVEYLTGNRAGPVVVGRTSRLPGAIYREEVIRLAGEEAANRALKAINKKVAELPK